MTSNAAAEVLEVDAVVPAVAEMIQELTEEL
jgi:hypothetical protein